MSNQININNMANSNVSLPYGVTKKIKISGKNQANTEKRSITDITFVKSTAITVVLSASQGSDPLEIFYDVTNTSTTLSQQSTITWNAKNELGAAVQGITPTTLIPADPAVTIESTEVA